MAKARRGGRVVYMRNDGTAKGQSDAQRQAEKAMTDDVDTAQFIPGDISAADRKAVNKFLKDNKVTAEYDSTFMMTTVTNGKNREKAVFFGVTMDEAKFEYGYETLAYEHDKRTGRI